jgi:ribosome-dependent ATPase
VIGLMFPAAWFQPISVGTFTKGLGFSDLWFNGLVLALFALGFLVAAHIFLQKQET